MHACLHHVFELINYPPAQPLLTCRASAMAAYPASRSTTAFKRRCKTIDRSAFTRLWPAWPGLEPRSWTPISGTGSVSGCHPVGLSVVVRRCPTLSVVIKCCHILSPAGPCTCSVSCRTSRTTSSSTCTTCQAWTWHPSGWGLQSLFQRCAAVTATSSTRTELFVSMRRSVASATISPSTWGVAPTPCYHACPRPCGWCRCEIRRD